MKFPIRQLGLGGGGIKGILHIGALLELSKHQKLYFPDGIYGSSIGSIIATYIAFELPIENAVDIAYKHLVFEKSIPTINISEIIQTIVSGKGMFSMKLFEKQLIEMFHEAGLDIQNKKISDASMPLFIIASNITKRIPAILSGNTPLLEALKCSCCVPGVFIPQELYNNFYIDGDIFSPCISAFLQKDGIGIMLPREYNKIDSNTIQEINPIEYLNEIFSMIILQITHIKKTKNTISITYPGFTMFSNLEDFKKEDLLRHAGKELMNFLDQENLLKTHEMQVHSESRASHTP